MKTNKNNKKLIFIGIFAFLLIISGASLFGFNLATLYDGGTGEVQYQEITIDNSGGSALTNYQHEIVVNYNPNMQSDFDDVRFYDGETLLKHDKVSFNSNFATFIVQTSIDADTSKTIYMYYGNPDAVDVSDTSIYEIYDGFEDSTILTDGSASTSYVSGKVGQALRLDGSQTYARKTTTTTYTKGYIYETWIKYETPSVVNLGGIVVAGQATESAGYYFITDNRNTDLIYNRDIHLRKDANADNVYGDATRYGDLTPNTWYRMKAVWDSDSYLSCYLYEEDGTLFDQYENILATSYSTGKIGFASYEVNIFDEFKVRQCVANPPTITFGTLYNENGEEIIPYFIESDNDVVIPVTLEASGSDTLYISKTNGYISDAKRVYEFYEDGSLMNEYTSYKNGKVASVPNPSGSGDVLKIYGGTVASQLAHGITFPINDLNSLILESDTLIKDTNGQLQTNVLQGDYDDRNTIHISINEASDDIRYYTSSWISLTPYTFNTWVNVKAVVFSTSQYDIYVNDVLKISDVGVRGTVTSFDNVGLFTWEQFIGYSDNIRVSKYTSNPPSYSITDMGNYYKVDITNNEASQLTHFQVTIDDADLDIVSQTDSLLIMNICPITLSEETTDTASTVVNSDVIISATFSDTVQDAKATITKPDTSSELVVLTNTEGNTWSTTLNYAEIGTYTISNFKINSDSETIDSSLTFDLTAIPITVSNETLTKISIQTGSSTTLSVTFSDTVTDVKSTVTKPDTTSELVVLSNSEDNTWTKELTYTELGNYTIANYKINSESETFNSTLQFNVTELIETPEIPTVPSSSGGGGSTYTPPVEEEFIENTTEIVKNIVPSYEDGAMNADVLDNPKVLGMFMFVFVILGILAYGLYKKN